MRRVASSGAGIVALTLGLLLALPGSAYACPVCFTGNEANRLAYLGTFVFLTVLPLTCMGLLIWWLRKRARELAERDDAERAPRAATHHESPASRGQATARGT